MTKTSTLRFLALLVAAIWCVGSGLAEAAPVTKYFAFYGAQELWNWTATGKTKLGANVTGSTNPGEMADPAKLTWYNAAGVPQFAYRNYRPEPNGFTSLNNWKTATTSKLVAFNLSGEAAGYGSVLPLWDETVHVTAIGSPTAAPGYDNLGVGVKWFAQTAYRSELGANAPTWWCELDVDGVPKSSNAFTDYVEYTFDSYYIWPDGTVPLWIGGFVTDSLAGMEGGTAAYGVLEGTLRRVALDDFDGDGYLSKNGAVDIAAGADDCNDSDPNIHPGAPETAGDGIDSNCDGQDDCFIATAAFGSSLDGKIQALRVFRDGTLLNHAWGRVFVDMYYSYSPPVATFVRTHDAAKIAVRTALLPVVGAAWVFNNNKLAVLGIAFGLTITGLMLRRRETMKATLVVLLALSLMGFPMLASADTPAPVKTALTAALQTGKSCAQAVESLLLAGYPVAEVIPAAMEACKDCNPAEIITAAIRVGADPFTVAYVSKQSGVDLNLVVAGLQDPATTSASGAAEETASFAPPAAPVGVSSVPVIVTGTGSAWGSSHYVASPSL